MNGTLSGNHFSDTVGLRSASRDVTVTGKMINRWMMSDGNYTVFDFRGLLHSFQGLVVMHGRRCKSKSFPPSVGGHFGFYEGSDSKPVEDNQPVCRKC